MPDPAAARWQADFMARRETLMAKDPNYGRIGVFQGGDNYTLSGDQSAFSFDAWLARDKTLDPVRDIASSGTPGSLTAHQTYTTVGPLAPPLLVEE